MTGELALMKLASQVLTLQSCSLTCIYSLHPVITTLTPALMFLLPVYEHGNISSYTAMNSGANRQVTIILIAWPLT